MLAVRAGTFFAWLWEVTIVRDTRNYHEPRTKPADAAGRDTISVVVAGDSRIPGPTSEELLAELRPKYTNGRYIIDLACPDVRPATDPRLTTSLRLDALSPDDLALLGTTEEVRIETTRPDGTTHRTIIWIMTDGDDVSCDRSVASAAAGIAISSPTPS